MLNIKLLVYDLDGTLVDAFEDIRAGLNDALTRNGLAPLELATVRQYVGDGARMLVRRALGPANAELFAPTYEDYLEYYRRVPERQVRLYPDVAETLRELRARGLRQAILTNKPEAITRQVCAQLGLDALIDGIWGEVPGTPRKPDAAALLRIARHFDVDPRECAMVGDGPADFQVARNAGARVFGVTWGQLSRAQAEALAPDLLLESMKDLLRAASFAKLSS